jgi:hypothetical protein
MLVRAIPLVIVSIVGLRKLFSSGRARQTDALVDVAEIPKDETKNITPSVSGVAANPESTTGEPEDVEVAAVEPPEEEENSDVASQEPPTAVESQGDKHCVSSIEIQAVAVEFDEVTPRKSSFSKLMKKISSVPSPSRQSPA